MPLYFLGAEYGAGSVLELAPSIPTPVGKEFSIAGVLTGNEARISLIFGTSTKVIAKEVVLINQKKTTGSDPLIRKIWAQLFLNFGKPNQEKKELTIRLKEKKEVVELGRFSIGAKP